MELVEQQHVAVAELKKRGWTHKLILECLGEPDQLKQNPYYKCAAPMRLYRTERVKAAEQSEQYRVAFAKATVRKARAASGTATKQRKLLASLDNLEISVPHLPMEVLIEQACQHYNTRKELIAAELTSRNYLKYCDKINFVPASPMSTPEFLERIMVNYLRHSLTHYEHSLAEVFGKVGKHLAYLEINRQIYAAISEAYPTLAAECERQLQRKEQTPEEDLTSIKAIRPECVTAELQT